MASGQEKERGKMTYTEQTKLIKGLIANVQDDILKESIKYPETWDGVEIRWRVADIFSQVVFGEVGKRKGKRYLDYKNHVLVTGLL